VIQFISLFSFFIISLYHIRFFSTSILFKELTLQLHVKLSFIFFYSLSISKMRMKFFNYVVLIEDISK